MMWLIYNLYLIKPLFNFFSSTLAFLFSYLTLKITKDQVQIFFLSIIFNRYFYEEKSNSKFKVAYSYICDEIQNMNFPNDIFQLFIFRKSLL